mmetsp:Transcript_22169/g.61383  ORF Transcript_22169/g.61383 Transcript_22169/m.61383 type:complete len:236 (+) Transcript_22169:3133-3840(+)
MPFPAMAVISRTSNGPTSIIPIRTASIPTIRPTAADTELLSDREERNLASTALASAPPGRSMEPCTATEPAGAAPVAPLAPPSSRRSAEPSAAAEPAESASCTRPGATPAPASSASTAAMAASKAACRGALAVSRWQSTLRTVIETRMLVATMEPAVELAAPASGGRAMAAVVVSSPMHPGPSASVHGWGGAAETLQATAPATARSRWHWEGAQLARLARAISRCACRASAVVSA